MSPISHALLPLLIGRRWIPRRPDGAPAWRQSGMVALAGVLPDLLNPHLALEDRHAAFSHSLAAWLLFTFGLGVACLTKPLRRHRVTAMLCVVAYLLHLGCDFITGGVPLFAPAIPGVRGEAWLPFWSWFVLDGALLACVYIVYRWLPLRRRITCPARKARNAASAYSDSRSR